MITIKEVKEARKKYKGKHTGTLLVEMSKIEGRLATPKLGSKYNKEYEINLLAIYSILSGRK